MIAAMRHSTRWPLWDHVADWIAGHDAIFSNRQQHHWRMPQCDKWIVICLFVLVKSEWHMYKIRSLTFLGQIRTINGKVLSFALSGIAICILSPKFRKQLLFAITMFAYGRQLKNVQFVHIHIVFCTRSSGGPTKRANISHQHTKIICRSKWNDDGEKNVYVFAYAYEWFEMAYCGRRPCTLHAQLFHGYCGRLRFKHPLHTHLYIDCFVFSRICVHFSIRTANNIYATTSPGM